MRNIGVMNYLVLKKDFRKRIISNREKPPYLWLILLGITLGIFTGWMLGG